MSEQQQRKAGNSLHPSDDSGIGVRGNRWLSSESAVEFSTKHSTDSWINPKGGLTAKNLLPPMRDAKTGKPKFISASFTAGEKEYPDIRQIRSHGRRRSSINNNKRVVSHLRRRLRQRLSDAFIDDCPLSDGEDEHEDDSGDGSNPLVMPVRKDDIFSKYNDIGGRLSKEGHRVTYDLRPQGTPPNILKDVSATNSAAPAKITFNYSETGSASLKSTVPSRNPSAKDDTKSINSSKSSTSDGSNGDPSNVSNVVVVTVEVDGQSKGGVGSTGGDAGNRGKALTVSRRSSATSIKSLRIEDVSPSRLSNASSAKSLHLEESSLPVLPKIDMPKSPSRTASSTPHSSMSPEFKLPAIKDGRRRSLVSPTGFSDKKSSLDEMEGTVEENNNKGPMEENEKSNLLQESAEVTETSAQPMELDEQSEQISKEDIELEEEVKDDEYGSNEEQAESKGFDLDEEVSPVPTPQPVPSVPTCAGVVTKKKTNLTAWAEQIYQGRVDQYWPIPSRIVRVYVSSSFLDFEAERTALVAKCYPKLRSLCRQRGYEFQVCDMRWGLYDTVVDNHSFAELCLKQLKSCQVESTALNFVSFVGHRYGGRGLPPSVPVDVFEAVLSTLEKEKDKLLERKKRPQRIFISESSIFGEPVVKRKISDHNAPTDKAKLGLINEKTSQKTAANATVSTTGTSRHKTMDGARKPVGKPKKSFLTRVNKMVSTIKIMDLGRKRKELVVDNTAKEDEGETSETESEKMMDERQVEKEFESNISALQTWFKLDENAVPPVYQLQNISCEYRDILSNDKTKKMRARNQWLVAQKRLHKVFSKYLKKALKSDQQYIDGFSMSVTEKEINNGIISTTGDLHSKALFFRRQISDLKSNLQDYAAKHYIDLQNLRPEIDTTLLQKIEDLKKEKIPGKLPFTNIIDLSVAWFKEGIDPKNRPHSIYIDRLANEFYDVTKNKLEKCLDDVKAKTDPSHRDNLCEDVAQHLNLVYDRCRTFYGRADTLTHIKQYLLSDSNLPLVLYGPAGSGKTSIMAKTAQLTREWMKRDDVAVVIRCIGHTLPSVNIRMLTRQLCQQLCHIYDMEISSVPQDYFGVLNDFSSRLSAASSDKPLVLFLDGLDQLRTEPSSQSILTWLPKQLPDNVHLVVSTSTTDGESFKALKKLLGPGNNLLEVPNLTETESQFILDNTLLHCGRTISPAQREVVMAAVAEEPLPLYVKLAAQEALLWQSAFTGRQLFLPNNLGKVINALFMRLETTHGEPFVRRALGYITAAYSGITWTELEDLLSLDEAVMSDIAVHHGSSVRRLPPALWCRLRTDLEPYLNVGLVDNVQTYRWCHKCLHQGASDRYLTQRDKATSYHSVFVDYFLGKWTGVKKPFQGSQTGADRLVDDQPLMWNTGGDNLVKYNLRKLNELPYHLIQANQMELLKSQTLFNYEFMLAKLKAMSLYSVLDDLQRALVVQPNNVELRLMSDTLQLSMDGLTKDSNQLATQLIGRLQNMIAGDQPMVIGDTKKYPMLSMMVAQAHRSSVPTLIPSKTCLAPPGGVLNDLLAGHTKVITAVAAATTGSTAATASLDGTIKLWDLCNRKVIKTIQVETYKIASICFCVRNLYLASITSTNHILVWNIRKGTQILTIDQYIDPPIISTAGADEEYLVAFFSGSNVMRTWQIGQECCMVKEVAIISGRVIHKDESICVSPRANGNKVLYAFRSDNRAYVTDATTGQRIHELVIPGEAASVTSLSMSHDYYIMACRYQYMKLSEIHHLELFDIRHGTHLRAIRGCTQDSVNELYVNKMGSHALCLSPSAKSNTTHIAVWNLETDDHKHLAKHPQISSMGACTDLNYCISASKQDKVLRIWNLSKKVNERETSKPIGTAKSSGGKNEGIVQIVPMRNNPRYVVAKSVNNGPVTVWNVVKGKCASSPVRIERGLVDSHDVVLVRNHHLVVLSDKGISSVSDRPLQVFQTVYVYNLKTKKYIRKLTGVFIIPSPAHEYQLLDGELLLGLSESRDHLIVWNLENGHMKYRIKNSFKELWRGLSKEEEEARMRPKRNTTARMPAWDRRSETMTARGRRREAEVDEEKKRLDDLNMEKENTIEQYMMSLDEKVIVCSYFAHHLCVFDVATQKHTHTLENHNSMLHLYNAAMTPTGSHLVHVNYDEYEKYSYVTLWDLKNGAIKKRIRNEPNVCCIGINPDATRVFFGNERNILKIWDVHGVVSTLRKLKGYPGMQLSMASKIFMIQGGVRALVFANDISIWDLDNATRLAMFSPDIRVTDIHVVTNSQLVALAVRDNADVITLRLKGRGIEVDPMDLTSGEELFGETTGDSTDEEEDEDEEGESGGDNNSIKSDTNNY